MVNATALAGTAVQPNQIQSNLAGGRAVVSSRYPQQAVQGLAQGVNNTSRVRYTIDSACSDVRLLFGNPFHAETPLINEVWVKAGIEVPNAPVGLLSSVLSTGAAITALPVQPLGPVLSAGTVTITDPTGVHSQTFSNSPTTAEFINSITVTSQTPNYAYPAGSTITTTVIYPVTFAGAKYGVIDPPNGSVISDPIPVEFTAGQVVYVRSYQQVPFTNGSGYLALAAAVTAGATTVTTTTPPTGVLPQTVTLDITNAEQVTVNSFSGTSSPYTLNLAAAIANNHASGVAIGQQGFSNIILYADQSEAAVSAADNSYAGAITAATGLSAKTTTTVGAITAGQSSFTASAAVYGATVNVDTAGTVETVTVRTWQGTPTSGNQIIYITGTFANNHTGGVIVQAGVASGNGCAPLAIVADRVVSRVKCVTVEGDSIAYGYGYGSRAATSWITLMLDGAGIPYFDLGKPSEQASQFVLDATRPLRGKLITLGDWALIEYATNDIYIGGGYTLAALRANIEALALQAKNRGMKVALCTILPHTSSTDSFATVTNQSITLPTQNTVRVGYNDWLRAWQSNGLQGTYMDALLEVANVMEVNSAGTLTQDGGYWAPASLTVNATTGPWTAEGIHPSTVAHAAIAASFSASTTFV